MDDNSMANHKETEQALRFIRQQTTNQPVLGLILGSGLSALAEMVENPIHIETHDIPGYPSSTVVGHKGRLVFGTIAGKQVVFVQGRLHVYEGHDVHASTFPVRLMAALGVQKLIVTNAAGGIHPSFKPGTLMWITDHINWTYRNPRIGSPGGSIARDQITGSLYDGAWLKQARKLASHAGIATENGTYLWTLGPSYETKAEIKAFKLLGADAVGMSTVPEVIEAHAAGMKILGLSTITNFAAGLSDDHLNHEEVLEVGQRVRVDLERLVLELIKNA